MSDKTLKEEYEMLLVDYPAGGPNPFEHKDDDAKYFLWLSNRRKCCGKLSQRIIDIRELRNNNIPNELMPGYTALLQYERKFVLFMGDVSYADIHEKRLSDNLIYKGDDISENDLVADDLLFVYREEKNGDVRITNAHWIWHPNLIKELTGKEQYSISDARKIINSMRNTSSCVYACIGVKEIWTEYWH